MRNNSDLRLVQAAPEELRDAMAMIDSAKELLRKEGVDQWQNGYPDEPCIRRDLRDGKGYFVTEGGRKLGYLCIDFDGEPAYEELQGQWGTDGPYVVVHRMALAPESRGKKIGEAALSLAGDLAAERGVHAFRVDTDEENARMRHILGKLGFTYRGTIWFDNSVKIAYDKVLEG